MWVGGVADSQTRSKPLKTSPNHPENRLFQREFHLSFSQISQKSWDGWTHLREISQKNVFLDAFPKVIDIDININLNHFLVVVLTLI